jgi:hypothetical protein
MGEILSKLQKEERHLKRNLSYLDKNTMLLLESPEMQQLRLIEKTIDKPKYDKNYELLKMKKELEKIKEDINEKTEVVNIETIKILSLKYRLGFFKIDEYRGYKPPYLSNTILKWFETNKKPINEYDLETKIYVLSNIENFDIRTYFNIKWRFKKSETFIFYKENNDNYLLIDSFGKKNPLRNLWSFTYDDDLSHFAATTYLMSIPYSIIWSTLLSLVGQDVVHSIWIFIISLFSSVIPKLICYENSDSGKPSIINDKPRMNIEYMWKLIDKK